MRILFTILFVFVSGFVFSQVETSYLPQKYFITSLLYKDDLNIKISEYEILDPVEIKGNLYMIPYSAYLKYKTEVDNNIDLYKCVIRKVMRNELIKPEL